MEIGIKKYKGFFPFLFFLISGLFIFFCSCGVKGPPLQPILKIIPAVENVKFFQKGKLLLVEISLPESYTDNTPLVIKRVKIHYNFYPVKELVELKRFIKESKSEEVSGENRKNIFFKKEIKDFPSFFKMLIQYWDSHNKSSQFSKLFEFEVKAPPPFPKNVKAEVREDGILLKWDFENKDKDIGFFVYFSEGEEFQKINQHPISKNEFLFKDFTWEKEYRFKVSSILKNIYESDDSEEISVFPVDKFPPPSPRNLVAIPEEGSIILKWDAVDVPDFEKYNVYRKENGNEELLTPNGTKENLFEDRKGEKGKIYKYYVTAVDRKGNESEPSNLAEEKFR